jgi:hypothetical protein
MDENRKSGFWAGHERFFCKLHEVFFSANVACALGYALLLYVVRTCTAFPPPNDSGYYFFRGAVRVRDLLHLGAIGAVSTHAAARRGLSIQWDPVAIEVMFAVSVCSAASLVLLLVTTFATGRSYRVIFNRIAGVVALFAAPACCLPALKLRPDWPDFLSSSPPLWSFLFSVLAGEVVAFVILWMISRRYAISAWVSGGFVLLHSAFWGWILIPNSSLFIRGSWALYLLHLSLWLIPSVGAAWLLYIKPGLPSEAAFASIGIGKVAKWTLIPAVLGIAALLAVWLPNRAHPLSRPKNPQSAVVELSRDPCRGRCPVYTITIHGDGAVEYVGRRFVKVEGRQTGSLKSEEFAKILQELDQAHFVALDDRAFSWCFDTSSVSVTVSLDGRTKSVTSDAGCTGAKLGVQAEFVRAADDIDEIVGSAQWVGCDGPCLSQHPSSSSQKE